MTTAIRPLTLETMDDLGNLLASQRSADGCWCMWFIVSVKEYHAGRGEKNRAAFSDIVASSHLPTGLIAYAEDGRPVGWCAAGPRSRFARAIRTPTYRGRDPREDDSVWLIPCLLVHPSWRGARLSELLVRAAVELAAAHDAGAVEAFPLAGPKRRSADTQVGFQSVFARCGFATIERPSESRLVMRLDLERREPRIS